MTNKVEPISKMRNKKKPRTPEQIAEAAARTFLDKIPANLPEPDAFASGGDMSNIEKEKDCEND